MVRSRAHQPQPVEPFADEAVAAPTSGPDGASGTGQRWLTARRRRPVQTGHQERRRRRGPPRRRARPRRTPRTRPAGRATGRTGCSGRSARWPRPARSSGTSRGSRHSPPAGRTREGGLAHRHHVEQSEPAGQVGEQEQATVPPWSRLATTSSRPRSQRSTQTPANELSSTPGTSSATVIPAVATVEPVSAYTTYGSTAINIQSPATDTSPAVHTRRSRGGGGPRSRGGDTPRRARRATTVSRCNVASSKTASTASPEGRRGSPPRRPPTVDRPPATARRAAADGGHASSPVSGSARTSPPRELLSRSPQRVAPHLPATAVRASGIPVRGRAWPATGGRNGCRAPARPGGRPVGGRPPRHPGDHGARSPHVAQVRARAGLSRRYADDTSCGPQVVQRSSTTPRASSRRQVTVARPHSGQCSRVARQPTPYRPATPARGAPRRGRSRTARGAGSVPDQAHRDRLRVVPSCGQLLRGALLHVAADQGGRVSAGSRARPGRAGRPARGAPGAGRSGPRSPRRGSSSVGCSWADRVARSTRQRRQTFGRWRRATAGSPRGRPGGAGCATPGAASPGRGLRQQRLRR